MRYILIDSKDGDWFTAEFESKEEALKQGEYDFNCLSDFDRGKRDAFYLLESVNPDIEAPDHFDGNVVKQWI